MHDTTPLLISTDLSILSAYFNVIYHTILLYKVEYKLGPSWPWSYGNWILYYLCNQCLSPLTLWVQIPPRRGVCTFDASL